MRIGLNATAFNDRPSGARQRFVGIYGALIRQRPDWEFIIYEPTDCRVTEWFDGAPNVVARSTPIASSDTCVKATTSARRMTGGSSASLSGTGMPWAALDGWRSIGDAFGCDVLRSEVLRSDALFAEVNFVLPRAGRAP